MILEGYDGYQRVLHDLVCLFKLPLNMCIICLFSNDNSTAVDRYCAMHTKYQMPSSLKKIT